jgi:hypothetical protein
MIITNKVNNKLVIKIPKPMYFHCFKLSDSSYALFDIKMDMPLVIGSLSIIQSTKLPTNSTVFYYEVNNKDFFEKLPKKIIDVRGTGSRTKAPLRYNYIDNKMLFYHHFKISNISSVLFDSRFDMPLAYNSNQKIQAVLNVIPKTSTIFYYKEDLLVKNSFKLFMTYVGRED